MVQLLSIVLLILNAVWFILPAYIANLSPAVFYKFFGKYAFPIDSGKNFFDKRRIFGDGKTWNGLAVGVLASSLVGYAQGSAFAGLALGSGALFGDLVKSFFKRRLGFERGRAWFPFDQIDFILGAFLFYWIFLGSFETLLQFFIVPLLLTPVLHLLTNWIGFKLKLKKEPW